MFDREIVVTFFGFQEAVEPQPRKKLWSEFVSDLKKGHEVIDPARKGWSWQFNLAEFKVGGKRRNKDVTRCHGLVIDYDANVTIEEALDIFGSKHGYEFVLFTSFNHQRKKTPDDYKKDKFRVVLPFKEPMPGSKYASYGKYLTEGFAPGCDPRLAVVSQLYTYLYCPQETAHLAKVIHREGTALDWRQWPNPKTGEIATIKTSEQGKSIKRSRLYLEPKDTIRTATNQWITVEDIDRHISDVYCPFHADKSPGAFVNKSVGGNIYLHCHKCGTAYLRRERDETTATESLRVAVVADKATSTAGDEVSDVVEEPYDRARREKLLIKGCIQGWEAGSLLLYAFEGFGKSRLCPLLAQVDRLGLDDRVTRRHQLPGKKRVCIVFATKTNKQAVEQAEGFRTQVIPNGSGSSTGSASLRVQLITGRVHNLKEIFGVDAVTDDGSHPWDAGDVNHKKTLVVIKEKLDCDTERAKEIWDQAAADDPDFDNHEIIVTTHERVRAWGRIQDQSSWKSRDKIIIESKILPDGTIIFIDDPGRSDFMLLAPYEENYVKARIEGKPLEQVQIGDFRYFVRPNLFHLDSGLYNAKIIFTTTEMITRKLIEKNFPDIYVPVLMPPNKMNAGDIAIISTRNVHASRDGLMLALVHALERDGLPVKLIADGMGAQWNHQTNKGVNSFDSDILIEVSFPTPAETTLLANEIYGSTDNLRVMQLAIVLDKMHQAIGRVGGYRFSDKPEASRNRCVVLCDPKMRDALVQQTRYFISYSEHADDWRDGGLKKPEDLYGLVSWYMRHVTRWITERDGRYFLSDVRKAIGSAGDPRRIDRLLKALNTVRKDITQSDDSPSDPNAARILEDAIGFLESERGEDPNSVVSAA